MLDIREAVPDYQSENRYLAPSFLGVLTMLTTVSYKAATIFVKELLADHHLDCFTNFDNKGFAEMVICEGKPFTPSLRGGHIRVYQESTNTGRLKVRVAIDNLSRDSKKAVIEAIKTARCHY
ncbi:MAG: hypothetical protein N5P05_004591 [Chroococcopsis gigantea SAG 12.99]|nr:hypothetical protein [Chroococcopsis gigantea SAG 12.99]